MNVSTMKRNSFEWYECRSPPGEDRIAAVQRRFGVAFPQSYLALVRDCDGGEPQNCCFKVKQPGDDRIWTYGFGRLLSFREPMPHEIRRRMRSEPDAWREMVDSPWSSIEDYVDELPPGMEASLIPFAEGAFGDFLCFDYRVDRKNPDPPVVFWLHEFTDYDPAVRIAENFDTLLTLLGVCDSAEYFGPLADLNKRANE